MRNVKRLLVIGLKLLIVAAWFIFGTGLTGLVFVTEFPSATANGADALRNIIGNEPVALMETALFNIQDTLNNAEYLTGIITPQDPWGLIAVTGGQNNPGGSNQFEPGNTQQQPYSGSALHSNSIWMPPVPQTLGNLQNTGKWDPYIEDKNGSIVAYRTFLQPDASRPYALIGVVAFDLSRIKLNFILGTKEPYAPGVDTRANGTIPTTDIVPGKLLAAFNGGFKFAQGHFGAMENGFTSAPPQDGLGTVAIYKDGSIKIGEWNRDIVPSNDMVSFRQNGPLIIDQGIADPSADQSGVWGKSVKGTTATWRSGLAISADGKTLYYVAGQSMTVHALANALTALNVYNAMQLDINHYWVQFGTVTTDKNGKIQLDPLFPKEMNSGKDRFLSASVKDYFYITAAN
jgi:hypothetical protein